MTVMINNLGLKIRSRRKELGFKVYELAQKVGVHPVYISQIEKHNKLPSPEVLAKIVLHLDDNPESYFRVYEDLKYPEMKKIHYALLTHKLSPRQDQRLTNALNIKNDLIEKLRITTDSSLANKYREVLSNYDKLIDSFFKSALKNLSTIEPQTAKRHEKHLKEQK